MNAIVIKGTDGQPVTTSLAIAEGTDVTHEAVIKLVRAHSESLTQFGEVRFEIRLNQQGSSTEFAVLNEQQSALIIAFMRNSDIVVAFKVALIKGFYEMRAALAASSKADRASKLSGSHKAALTIAKQAHVLAKAFGFTGNQAILYADKAATGATGISPLAMMGATHLLADQRGMTLTPTELGRAHGMSAQAMNKYLFDQGLQAPSAAGTGWEPTPKAAGHCEWLDTGKAYSAGTPIKQLKWFSTVSEFFQNANA